MKNNTRKQKIGFVFTNYNNSGFTEGAINSVLNLDSELVEIVVVDNDSDEDDKIKLQRINKNYKNVHVVFSNENIGYFGGLNIGIAFLRKEFPTLYLMVIGNNDVLFDKDFDKQLWNRKNILDNYPVIAPNIVTQDGFHQNPHVIKKITKLREFIYDIYHLDYRVAKLIIRLAKLTKTLTARKDQQEYEKAQEIYLGYGACYILTAKFFELYEALWAPTFLMHEELFLSRQLSEKGFSLYYEPSIKLTHLMHATTDKLPGKLKWKFSKESHKKFKKYAQVK